MPKGKSKSKGGQPRATHDQLRKLIEGVIDAHHRGDPKQRDAAVEALGKFESRAGSPELRQSAVEARMAAGHDVSVDVDRRLREIAARLG